MWPMKAWPLLTISWTPSGRPPWSEWPIRVRLRAKSGFGRSWVAIASSRSGLLAQRLPDRLEVVGRIELGAEGAPGLRLDHPVALSRLLGGQAQRHHLADAHDDMPGDHLDALGREALVEAGLLEPRLNLVEVLRLVMSQEDGQHQHSSPPPAACRSRRRRHP